MNCGGSPSIPEPGNGDRPGADSTFENVKIVTSYSVATNRPSGPARQIAGQKVWPVTDPKIACFKACDTNA